MKEIFRKKNLNLISITHNAETNKATSAVEMEQSSDDDSGDDSGDDSKQKHNANPMKQYFDLVKNVYQFISTIRFEVELLPEGTMHNNYVFHFSHSWFITEQPGAFGLLHMNLVRVE